MIHSHQIKERLNERSQTQKDKYHMISRICGIKKKKKVELIVTKSKTERWLGGGQKWGDID